jgi:hypothetical protein
MIVARQNKEIVLTVVNEIGVLNEIVKAVSEKGLSILAITASPAGACAVIRLITEDNLRAADELRHRDYAPMEVGVVTVEVPHKAGMLRMVTERLGKAGIDIKHIHGSALIDAERSLLVLSTADDDRAVVVLNG